MKIKLIIAICICFVFRLPAQKMAAQRSNEISASYGTLTNEQLIAAFISVNISIVNGVTGNYTVTNAKGVGAVFLTFKKNSESGRTAVGFSAGMDNTTLDILNSSNIKKGELKMKSFTIAGEGLVNYILRENFRFYGNLGLGYTFLNFKYNPSATASAKGGHVNFQVSPLCIKYGKNFGGLLELGIGYKGILNVGLFANF
jgi:hypothetical protein